MAKLIYSGIMSLDGYVADENGTFEWSAPDPQVHQFVNDLERPIGTYLYGRRMYEVMAYWESGPGASDPYHIREYGDIWRSADKIVYSSTLQEVASDRTRIERAFEPAAVRKLKAAAASDLSIGGAELASQAIRAGLVDEYHLFLSPVVVGGGTPFLPDHVRLALDLLDEHVFGNGVVHLHYGSRGEATAP
jgi:dihydrofolate reductase